MAIFLCAGETGLEHCLSQLPDTPYWLSAVPGSDAPAANRHTDALPFIDWPLLLAEPQVCAGSLVVAVEAAAMGASEQAALAGVLAAHALARHTLLFAPPAASLAGQTLGAPAHDSCLPAVVFATGAMDPSVALSVGLLDGANRHGRVLMLDGDACVEYAEAARSLRISGGGTVLVATAQRGGPTLANAIIDVLTAGMMYTLG
jgi:hypothetical protein